MTAAAYIDLQVLKDARRITGTADDAALQRAVTAASRAIDRRTGRSFGVDVAATQRTYRRQGRVVVDDDGERLLVDDIGDVTGLVVEIGQADTWTAVTDYETLPYDAAAKGKPVTSLLRPSGTWGSGPAERVRVTAKHGWPAVPEDIAEAALLLANRLYMRKDSPQGVTGSTEFAVRVSRTDPDFEALISPFILPGFA